MANDQLYQAHYLPGDVFRPILHQPNIYVPQDAMIPPPGENGQPEELWEDIPQPVGGVARPPRPQDPHNVNVGYDIMADHHLRVLDDHHAAPYIFPDVRHAQGIPAHGQANTPVNQDHGRFGYAPLYIPPGHAQGVFFHPFDHQVPIPVQPREDNIRRLASRYFYHPDSQVNMVWMEPGTAGRFKVTIILEASDIF